MNQRALFHETIFDAIGADIAAAGGFKTVASKLWPAEAITSAANKLRNAINPEQAQKLCPQEVLQIKRIAREAGSTATIDYEAQQLSYRVEWIEPEDELKELLARYLDSQELQGAMRERIDKLIARTQLRSVK